MKLQKTQIAAAVGAALLLGGTAVQAQNIAFQAYGQVNRAMMFADDGTQSKWFNVDNEASGTRFGFTGTGQAMPGLRAGFRIEVDLQSNESQRVTFAGGPSNANPATTANAGWSERHMDVWLDGAWGRMNLGQGDGAANGASESDLSGTGIANGIGVADLGGGINYRTTGTTPPGFGPSVGATINQQDFESRYDRLMYTTPTFNGFRVQASYGENANTDIKEISAWYGGKMGGFGDLAAAIGYSLQDATAVGLTKDKTMGGSVSWLHTSGFNLTLSYTDRTAPTTVPGTTARSSTFTYLKGGFKRGPHAIAVDYALGDDFAAAGDEATMMGIGYVYNPVRWLELYAAYKVHSLDRSGTSLDDVTIGTVGTRIRF